MWKRSFVATTVALGGDVDDALAALGASDSSAGDGLDELVLALRAPLRSTRAGALAKAVRDVALAVDEGALR